MAKFYPIGHVSLDEDNLDAKDFGLDLPATGVYWIKTFYVSQALRGKGVGRAAMDMIEAMAVEEPLCAKTLALDTMHRDDALRMYAAKYAATKEASDPKVQFSRYILSRNTQLITIHR